MAAAAEDDSQVLVHGLGDGFRAAAYEDPALARFLGDAQPPCRRVHASYYSFEVPLSRERFDQLFPLAFSIARPSTGGMFRGLHAGLRQVGAEDFVRHLERAAMGTSARVKGAFVGALADHLDSRPLCVGLSRSIVKDSVPAISDRSVVSGLAVALHFRREQLEQGGGQTAYRASLWVHAESLVLSAPPCRRVLQVHARPLEGGGHALDVTNLAGELVRGLVLEGGATVGDLRAALAGAGVRWGAILVGRHKLEEPGEATIADVLRMTAGSAGPAGPRAASPAGGSDDPRDDGFLRRPAAVGSRPLPDDWSICLTVGRRDPSRACGCDGPSAELTAASGYMSGELEVVGSRVAAAMRELIIAGSAVDPRGAQHRFRHVFHARAWGESHTCCMEFEGAGDGGGDAVVRLQDAEQDLSFFIDGGPVDAHDSPDFAPFRARAMFCADHRTRRGWGMTFGWHD